MRVFLTARDLLSVCEMAATLLQLNEVDKVTIVDCHSTYAPLLTRYNELPPSVEVMMCSNLGPRAAWHVCREQMMEGPYAVSDGDLDISGWPVDAITIMKERLLCQPHLIKVGAALEISELPRTRLGERARDHESQFWVNPTIPGFFAADIDTTFAVYREPDWTGYGPAERCSLASARHLAWYLEAGKIPSDWLHYLQRVDPAAGTHWSILLSEQGVE